MRKCFKCKNYKNEDSFYKYPYRYDNICKQCKINENTRRRREKSPLEILECPNCKRKFKQTRKDEKYCTLKCQENMNHKYRKYKEDKCKLCGFIPINPCQLDVDHIDGNHNNNDPDNLQTLCANCHRLKTYISKEGVHRKMRNKRKTNRKYKPNYI